MASSISSSKRSLSSEEKENDQKLNNDSSNKKLKTTLDSLQEIRLKIIEEFRKRNLEIPLHLINTIDRSETSETNRNDAEHRKELYARLSEYLDRRQVGNRVIPNIPVDARWAQKGVTVAGGLGEGSATNQLYWPHGLFVDDDQTMIIADCYNDRIIQWKMGGKNGQVVAGGNGGGNRLDQLCSPTDVLIDKETDSLIISDWSNRRVVRWSRRSGTIQGEILINNIKCSRVAMDDQRYLYISDRDKHEVRRYQIGDKNGTLVAGGNGKGASLNQLNFPTYIFVDQQQTVYVSDRGNHRVMKWNKGAKEGIVVAGGQGEGNALTQLADPQGPFVDTLGTIYVADSSNHRVMRWPKGEKQGTIMVGGNGQGEGANQFNFLGALSFDRHGNLFVVDYGNSRVQRFSIE
ncbi:unnamed protein product [Rotaria sordida]|uniref:Uncharacterized protein n=1 Tax=Rotaria sordida TaxID=392033 RepID=A0A815CH18_9BILA|nr:unnamed protein product [Rotaria sordida]